MEQSESVTESAERLSPTEKVVTEIAGQEDVSPLDLPPLHDVVDPAGLDQLFTPTGDAARMRGTVSFQYSGYDVTVHADGYVEAAPCE